LGSRIGGIAWLSTRECGLSTSRQVTLWRQGKIGDFQREKWGIDMILQVFYQKLLLNQENFR